jgi:hypothetical protein
MRSSGPIEGCLLECVQELRVLSNDAGYFTGRAVSGQDAQDALSLAEALMDYMYVISAQFTSSVCAEVPSRLMKRILDPSRCGAAALGMLMRREQRLYGERTLAAQRSARMCGRYAPRFRSGTSSCLGFRGGAVPPPEREARGDDWDLYWGKTRTPPPPENHGPAPGFPPDPLSCLPQTTDPAVPVTAEGASITVPAVLMTAEGARIPARVGAALRCGHARGMSVVLRGDSAGGAAARRVSGPGGFDDGGECRPLPGGECQHRPAGVL